MDNFFNNKINEYIGLTPNENKIKYVYYLYQILNDYFNRSLLPFKVSFDINKETNHKNLVLQQYVKEKEYIMIEIKPNEILFYDYKGDMMDRININYDEDEIRNKVISYIQVYFNYFISKLK